MDWIYNFTQISNAVYIFLTAICGLLGFAIGIIRKVNNKMDSIGGGLQSVLRNDIHDAYHKHTEKGFCTVEEKENIQKLYKHYKNLEGNGTADRLVDEINKMPTSGRKDNKK